MAEAGNGEIFDLQAGRAIEDASAFHQAVLALEPRTAVFDCDGTLWEPDSGQGFMLWSMRERQDLVSPGRRVWIDQRYALYGAGEVSEAAICGEMVQLYAGLPEAALREAARRYVDEQVRPAIFPEMAALVEALWERGTELWAVSSTSNWVVEAGLASFRIPPERTLAAMAEVVDGLATDRLLAVPTDEAKREALVGAGLPRPDVVFGNSIHDAAMLEAAAQPFAVHPNQALRALAEERGWPIFEPRPISVGRLACSSTD